MTEVLHKCRLQILFDLIVYRKSFVPAFLRNVAEHGFSCLGYDLDAAKRLLLVEKFWMLIHPVTIVLMAGGLWLWLATASSSRSAPR